MEHAPQVSIIMGVFNAQETLREALASIENQTYDSWELVICDDASTDSSWQILQDFQIRHGSKIVVLLQNATNRRLAYSLNRCLERAKGVFIARMDADDVSEPDRLRTQVEFLLQNPDIDVVGCAMRRFDETGLKDVLTYPTRPTRYSLRKGVPFAHATILAHRHVYETLAGYTVARRTNRSQDWDLWFRFFAAGMTGENLPSALYRVREDRHAIRRRTPNQRISAWQTTLLGYRRLGFPLHWYIVPTVRLAKGLVPARAVVLYRRWQHRRFKSLARRTAVGAKSLPR